MAESVRLVDRHPQVPSTEIVAGLVPPPHFRDCRFDTYQPDPAHPSQSRAREVARAFAAEVGRSTPTRWRDRHKVRRARSRSSAPHVKPGIYFDGGFGVGKTHILAAIYAAASGYRLFATFTEVTNLVGAIGFRTAVEELSSADLLCIDEFELDDPGDTVLMSSLLAELVGAGVRLAATSNTLPDRLGEGRFASDDFLREIQGLASHFDTVRIEGPDYRHRDAQTSARVVPVPAVAATSRVAGLVAADDFADLLRHLRTVHPSQYRAMVADLAGVAWDGVFELTDQADALRLVALVDRLYDNQVRVCASGTPMDEVFSADMLSGGYRKKYWRAISRLAALTRLESEPL